jgi:hypothetical protein
MMKRFLSILAGLTVLATPTNAQIPDVDELLELLPEQCLLLVQSAIIPCFATNPECLTTLPTAEDFESLPAPEEILVCEDIAEPVCPILTKCEPCLMEMGDLLSCILTNAEDIPQETVELINSCVFDCDDLDGDADVEVGMNSTDVEVGMNSTDVNVTESMDPVAEVPTGVPAMTPPISPPPAGAPVSGTSGETPAPSTMNVAAPGTPALSTAATKTMTLGTVAVATALLFFLMA